MHIFVTVGDIASIAGVATASTSLVAYLLKGLIFKPLKDSIDSLAKTVKQLSATTDSNNKRIEKEIKDHEVSIEKHEIRIKTWRKINENIKTIFEKNCFN